MAYGTAPDAFNEYLQIAERTSRECLDHFTKCIHVLYHNNFLRRPTATDIQKTYQLHEEKHGLPGMLGSIDCMHWDWKNFPKALHGQFKRSTHKYPTLMLEAVADQKLWIWHAYFEVPADGIYPAWSTFSVARDEKSLKFKRGQEAARKDIERAFGVLQGRWGIIQQPVRAMQINYKGEMMIVIPLVERCCTMLKSNGLKDRIPKNYLGVWYQYTTTNTPIEGTYQMGGPKRQRFYGYCYPTWKLPKDVNLKAQNHRGVSVLRSLKYFCYSHLDENTVSSTGMMYGYNLAKLTNLRERFYTSARNPVKEILLKLYLPDHRSILTDSKMVVKPPGFESSEFPDYVCKLDKALYGLKQAPRACMMGELTYFLGLQIKQDDKGISICQEQYTRNLLKKYEIHDSSSVKTPMVPPNNLGPDLAGKRVNETSYRGMSGSLMYLTATRADIQFSRVLCARYQSNSKESHLTTVKRILRYLKEKAPQVPVKYLVENWFVRVPRNSSQWLCPQLKLNMLLLLGVVQVSYG
ncbi:putative nuclease HARBI1 isoform X2 [Tanacetum coccineum]